MKWTFDSIININKSKSFKMDLYDFWEPAFLLWLLSLYKSWIIKEIWNITDPYLYSYLDRCDFISLLNNESNRIHKNCDTIIEITPITNETKWVDISIIVIKLLKWLNINESEYSFNIFDWIIRELIDNTKIHSKANFNKWGSYYMMQIYKKLNKINFCLIDNWIWIKESFNSNNIIFNKDEDYIIKAFERWQTSNKDIWAWNGLFFTKEIVMKSLSTLNYRTWNYLYSIKDGKESIKRIDSNWQGIFLDIEFKINNLNKNIIWEYTFWNNDINDILEDIFSN